MQQITTANRRNKGKIARIYGTKLAIAARADAISKNFIADKLKEQLDIAIKRIEASNPGKEDPESRQIRWDNKGRGGDWQRKKQHGRWQNRDRK